MESNSDIFVRTAAPAIGATYAFGRKFERDSSYQNPEDIGFAVPVDDVEMVLKFLELARAIEIEHRHHTARQPRVYAFAHLFPDVFEAVLQALGRQQRLEGTEFNGLLGVDVLLLPPLAHLAPWRLPEWMSNCPNLQALVRPGWNRQFVPVHQPATAA